MKWRRKLRAQRSRNIPPESPAECLPETIERAALADLERRLDVLTRGRGEQPPDKELAAVGRRAEAEVRRFFGKETLRGIQASAGASGNGTIVFAADRLLVTFLGRSAAMAITRKLYANQA